MKDTEVKKTFQDLLIFLLTHFETKSFGSYIIVPISCGDYRNILSFNSPYGTHRN